MERSHALRASRSAQLVGTLALALVVIGIVGALPPLELAPAGLGWVLPAMMAVLAALAAGVALAALSGGLRHGPLSGLLGAGAAAAMSGGAIGLFAGASSIAMPMLAGSTLVLAAAIADRRKTLVRGRGARLTTAVVVLLVAEATALAEIIPAVAQAISPLGPILLGTSAALFGGAALVALGGGIMPVGLMGAAAAISLLLAQNAGLELLIGLASLVAAHLVALRLFVEDATELPIRPDGIRLPELAAQLPDAVLLFDGRLQLRDWNAAATKLLGLDPMSTGTRLDDLLGITVADLPSDEATATIRGAGVGGLEISASRSDGGVTAIVRDPGRLEGDERLSRELRGTIEELLAARRTMELQRAELERASAIDQLTGVASRAAILDRLRIEIAQARRYRHPVAVVLLDIDDFGTLNAVHGSDAGDRVLREVALRMRLRVRDADALGRSGSDGFLAVLPHTDEAGAATFADALRHRLALRPIVVAAELVSVTVSVGVAVMRPGDDLELDELLSRVGEALDSARSAGGDRIALDRLHGLARLEDRHRDDGSAGTGARERGR